MRVWLSRFCLRPIEFVLTSVVYAVIFLYRHTISGILGPKCRYLPSCSEYMRDAICKHGLWNGGWIGLKRLMSCHPGGGSGFDPVPNVPSSCKRSRQLKNWTCHPGGGSGFDPVPNVPSSCKRSRQLKNWTCHPGDGNGFDPVPNVPSSCKRSRQLKNWKCCKDIGDL